MNNNEKDGQGFSQFFDGFIAKYAPLFAAHPNELVLRIARTDDNGFRGGPGSHCCGPETSGLVTATTYTIATILPGKEIIRQDATSLKLPVSAGFFLNCHGTNAEKFEEVILCLFEMLGMEETLSEESLVLGEQARIVPRLEFAVGDAEVFAAMLRVRKVTELLSLCQLAVKMGRPLGDLVKNDKRVAAEISRIVESLTTAIVAVEITAAGRKLGHLSALGINSQEAEQRVREKLEKKLGLVFG